MVSVPRFLLFSLTLLTLGLAPSSAFAHNMIVVATIRPEQPDQVRVEAYFEDDSPAEGAPVLVRDAAGNVIVAGKTGETGVWTFPRPKPGQYVVRVEYIGHDKEVPLPIADETSTGRFASAQPNIVVGVIVGLVLLLGMVLFVRLRRKRPVPKV